MQLGEDLYSKIWLVVAVYDLVGVVLWFRLWFMVVVVLYNFAIL